MKPLAFWLLCTTWIMAQENVAIRIDDQFSCFKPEQWVLVQAEVQTKNENAEIFCDYHFGPTKDPEKWPPQKMIRDRDRADLYFCFLRPPQEQYLSPTPQYPLHLSVVSVTALGDTFEDHSTLSIDPACSTDQWDYQEFADGFSSLLTAHQMETYRLLAEVKIVKRSRAWLWTTLGVGGAGLAVLAANQGDTTIEAFNGSVQLNISVAPEITGLSDPNLTPVNIASGQTSGSEGNASTTAIFTFDVSNIDPNVTANGDFTLTFTFAVPTPLTTANTTGLEQKEIDEIEGITLVIDSLTTTITDFENYVREMEIEGENAFKISFSDWAFDLGWNDSDFATNLKDDGISITFTTTTKRK